MRVGSVNVLEAMTWTDTRAEVLRGKMILTHAFDDPIHGYSFTCFTGTKVQILTQMAHAGWS